jgi:hypothetical protein
MPLKNLRTALKVTLQFSHSVLSLNKLNQDEVKGNFSKLLPLKLIKHSKHSLPFSLGRTIRGVQWENIHNDKMHSSLKSSINNNLFDEHSFSKALLQCYLRERHKSANYYLKIKNASLEQRPLWSLILPWEEIDFNYWLRNYEGLIKSTHFLGERFGHSSLDDPDLLQEISNSHAKKFNFLFDSISNFGFQGMFNRPKAIILMSDMGWRWVVGGNGNHRAYVMNIIGKKSFPVEIAQVVNIKEINSWFNVKSGLFGLSDAERIFWKFYNGDGPLRGLL